MWTWHFLLSLGQVATSANAGAVNALPQPNSPGRDAVVLLHGMGRSTLSMKRIEWALVNRGFHVLNVGYPSTHRSVEDLARSHLAPALRKLDTGGRVHFVTHSLGAIVLRQYLATEPMSNLGRVVMLGPPNRGSELAEAFKGKFWYRLATGPSGQQVGIGKLDLPRALGSAPCEVGVIAGDRSLNPLFSCLIPGPDDGKVSVESTRLEGMADFAVVHHSHTWLPWRRTVIRKVISFLETGRFAKP